MIKHTATAAQNNFGEIAGNSLKEPVSVTKNGQPYVVIMSNAEYTRLTGIEERYWGELAVMAGSSGFVDEAQTDRWFRSKQINPISVRLTKHAGKILDKVPQNKCQNIFATLSEFLYSPRKHLVVKGYNFNHCTVSKYKIIYDNFDGYLRIFFLGEI